LLLHGLDEPAFGIRLTAVKLGIMAKIGLIFHQEEHSVEISGTTRIIYKKRIFFPFVPRKTMCD